MNPDSDKHSNRSSRRSVRESRGGEEKGEAWGPLQRERGRRQKRHKAAAFVIIAKRPRATEVASRAKTGWAVTWDQGASEQFSARVAFCSESIAVRGPKETSLLWKLGTARGTPGAEWLRAAANHRRVKQKL